MSIENTCRAIGDETRRQILSLLKKGKMNASEIASHFDMAQASVSYHLNKLKEADLISEERDGNFIYYSLNTSVFQELLLWIKQFETDTEENLDGYENI